MGPIWEFASMNTGAPGWDKYKYIQLPNHNTINGNKLCKFYIYKFCFTSDKTEATENSGAVTHV